MWSSKNLKAAIIFWKTLTVKWTWVLLSIHKIDVLQTRAYSKENALFSRSWMSHVNSQVVSEVLGESKKNMEKKCLWVVIKGKTMLCHRFCGLGNYYIDKDLGIQTVWSIKITKVHGRGSSGKHAILMCDTIFCRGSNLI